MTTGQLSLKVMPTLPDEGEHSIACELCVRERLRGLEGVRDLRIEREDGGLRVTVDYEPAVTTPARVRDELRCIEGHARPDGDSRMPASVVVPIDNMRSIACETAIEHALARLDGVVAAACYAAGRVRIDFDPARAPWPRIEQTLTRLGYDVQTSHAVPPLASLGLTAAAEAVSLPGLLAAGVARTRRVAGLARRYGELTLVLLGGVMLLAGWIVHLNDGPIGPRVTLLALAAILSSTRTSRHAVDALRRLQLDVDVLMFAAAAGAALLGHYEEGALLLFLFGLGHAGEHLALNRARSAIESLGRLAPDTAAILHDDGAVETIPAAEVRVGQRVLVRPFDRMPVDGRVVEGASAVDQAAITGESMPVDKAAGDEVFAGTINGPGQLIVAVTRRADETTLARVIRMVEEAQTTKSPTQLFTDRIERLYVPVVFAATGALIVVPPLLGFVPRMGAAGHSPAAIGAIWGGWFYQAMAFLTAASPCALAIGTPAAVLCGIARAARVGVLVKGGGYLELLGRVRAVAFDKTGTLTIGRPTLTDVLPLDSSDEAAVLSLAAAVESEITHPLAEAIVRAARARALRWPRAAEVRQLAGFGAVGRIEADAPNAGGGVAVGRPERDGHVLSDDLAGRIAALRRDGKTVVLVTRDDQPVGLLALRDEPRAASRAMLDRLRALGIRHVAMLTGDHPAAAAAIAAELGVDGCHAGLMPEEKVREVDALMRRFGQVAMVGDGVNDAPALAHASLGIAMGAAGADVAMETADVVLMGSDLHRLPEAVSLSRFSRRIIKQNLVIALGVIAAVSPLAALGFAHLGLAVLLHEGSTVVVVLNALRILRHRA